MSNHTQEPQERVEVGYCDKCGNPISAYEVVEKFIDKVEAEFKKSEKTWGKFVQDVSKHIIILLRELNTPSKK